LNVKTGKDLQSTAAAEARIVKQAAYHRQPWLFKADSKQQPISKSAQEEQAHAALVASCLLEHQQAKQPSPPPPPLPAKRPLWMPSLWVLETAVVILNLRTESSSPGHSSSSASTASSSKSRTMAPRERDLYKKVKAVAANMVQVRKQAPGKLS